jgi:hypothetical protein
MSEGWATAAYLAMILVAILAGRFIGHRLVDGVLEARDITRAWLYRGRHRTPVVPTDSVS